MQIRDNLDPPENKVEKEEVFPKARAVRKNATIHQQLTTNSPSKNHVLRTALAKNPSKNTTPPQIKKTAPQKEI